MRDVSNIIILIWTILTVMLICMALYLGEVRKSGRLEISPSERQLQNQKFDTLSGFNGFSTRNEYEHFKRLHEYHGILASWESEDGTYVFKRDGIVCSLWDPLVRTDL